MTAFASCWGRLDRRPLSPNAGIWFSVLTPVPSASRLGNLQSVLGSPHCSFLLFYWFSRAFWQGAAFVFVPAELHPQCPVHLIFITVSWYGQKPFLLFSNGLLYPSHVSTECFWIDVVEPEQGVKSEVLLRLWCSCDKKWYVFLP